MKIILGGKGGVIGNWWWPVSIRKNEKSFTLRQFTNEANAKDYARELAKFFKAVGIVGFKFDE